MSTPSICFLLPFFLALLARCVRAQDTSIINPTTAAASAAPLQTASGYSYVGCWNETTGIANAGGARALTGGMSVGQENGIDVGCGLADADGWAVGE